MEQSDLGLHCLPQHICPKTKGHCGRFTAQEKQLHVIYMYRKVPKFSNAKKTCCNLPKIEEKRPNLRVFHQIYANGIANSEDPDQTAPLGAV